ncbi:glycosyltransferase family 2 protein [Spirosoma aerophilum]
MDLIPLIVISFFLLVLVVFYTYLGYGILLWIIVKIRRQLGIGKRVAVSYEELPEITLIVPAYNEINYLADKLKNSLDQDYPADRLHLLFVVEGSTDGSNEYLESKKAEIPNLSVLSGTKRLGKIEAMNNAMKLVKTPIVIFTDANTQLNLQAVTRLVRRFELPNVGAVTGEKRIDSQSTEAATGSGEGIYWRYESFLKRLDAELHTIVGAAGELFAIRTELYEPVEADTLLDDFIISLRIAGRGYRVEYEPNAYALERPTSSIKEEMKRKVRIAAGGFQSISRLTPLLNLFRYGWLSFQYISHRVLRWAITPFCLPLLFLLNIVILVALSNAGSYYSAMSIFWWSVLVLQIGFYIMAYIGYRMESKQTRWKVTFVPFYFVFMNWCVVLGLLRFWKGGLSGIWEKSARAA